MTIRKDLFIDEQIAKKEKNIEQLKDEIQELKLRKKYISQLEIGIENIIQKKEQEDMQRLIDAIKASGKSIEEILSSIR